ncbi:hypothetical protein G6F57_011656 [Rhizopus arrhizus]|uniref:Kri1-like C-terminal domain-containing protein n=1 Tax=Rhizopus oryzae TaxID=64495 RepID=A0A9P6XKE3_RHIOR|nr:hypothetical protein G6F23_008678 [Rhizopus arrhizus]KAG1425012.1 hypothetical protein G6F58_002108 [Rhizopus delemar]KAG0770516.1 hypothetical protein G6F24_000122 [Rhizopus arrhizus]KAG0787392.1 hypothetical protein G6F22_007332 [Rhizopus arrhizus]KAG0792610.1 hypothetical protein G6F21_004232 [Rhizopus arrhizus]
MRRDSVTSTSSDYSTASDSSNKSSGSSDKSEFEVQIKERENPNEDYKRPELLKKATEEIEAEVAAKLAEEKSSSESEYESDSDEEEDDEAKQLTPAVDSQIFRTIAAIRAKDPRVYDKTDFFENIKVDANLKSGKKEKALTLKDYERDILLNHGGFVDEEKEASKGLTHIEEQENLRNAFKNLSDDDEEDEEEDFLTKKEKTEQEKKEEEDEYKRFLLEQMKNDETSKKAAEEWSTYKSNPNISSEDAFLMDYVLNRGWVEKEGSNKMVNNEEEVDKDEADLDDIDRFESKYNFRFEEEGGTALQTYARNIEGSVRRKESKRARRRAKEKARKEALKLQKVEELKQQKNKKMKEIQEKLKEIYDISGSKALGLENIDLDADFDPSSFDAHMNTVFDNEYYEDGEDANVKPTWDDDIDTGLNDDDELIMDADYLPGGDKYTSSNKRKRDMDDQGDNVNKKGKKEQIEKLMDEYYSLNYEDVVGGDVFTRFKYTKTEPDNYGLTPEEILLAEDTELNKYVGIKQLAPYRPFEKQMKEKAAFKRNKKMKRKDIEKHISKVVETLEPPPTIPETSKKNKKKKKGVK